MAGRALDLCARFTVAALSSDATIDRGPADARRRATHRFGTPELADQLAGEGRNHDWPLLIQHQAHVQVTTTPIADDPPPHREALAAAGVIARRVAVNSDGWHHELPSTAAYCSLTRHSDSWKVSGVTFADSTSSAVNP